VRNSIQALSDELKRLKEAGVRTLPVSEESVRALAAAVRRRAGASRPAARPAPAAPARPVPVPEPAAREPKPAFPPPPVVELPAGDKAARWAALGDRVRGDPTCLAHVRPGKKIVLGVGNLDATIMFVGEAPGADEEVQGEPFVGAAGQLLNRMIAGMGLSRADVYIGNIMNWRPELPLGPGGSQVGNRPPTQDEMAYCLPYLRAQIDIVAPSLLVALGATAAQGLLGAGTFKALGEIRGQWREFQGRPLMITYHPSYILRNQSNRSKRVIWEDFLKVMERAGLAVSAKQRGYFLEK
jgi:DNA polymerase